MAQVKTAAAMFPLVESWQKSGLTQEQLSQSSRSLAKKPRSDFAGAASQGCR
jgi:hypothetical protein